MRCTKKQNPFSMVNITLFAQIISKLDRCRFNKLSLSKGTDKHNKGYTSWTHLVSMLFCQFAKSQSVRDISNGLRSATGNLNHMGVQKAPSKSSVSYQNKHRDHNLFKEYYFCLLESLGQQAGFKQVKFRIKSKSFCWIPPPSVYACPCLTGLNTKQRKELLKCIPYLIGLRW